MVVLVGKNLTTWRMCGPYNMKLNEKQQQDYDRLKLRWDIVSEPHPMIGWHDSAIVMVESKETGAKMTIGIEPDGSTHS